MTTERIFETEWLLYHIHKHNLYNKIYRTFVDVGAGDGKLQSNSLAFIEMGWEAILIDGLQSNIDKCKRLHVGRPFVKCIQAVLSDKVEDVNFQQDSRFWALSGIDYTKQANTTTVTLSSILRRYKLNKIGFMSIDLEGHETKILTDLINNNILPQILIVEANEPWMAAEHKELLQDSYKIVGSIAPNSFYVRKDLKW